MFEHKLHEPQNPLRLVVLGAGGFIGRALVKTAQAAGVKTLALGTKDVDLTAESGSEKLRSLLKPEDAVVFVAAIDKGKASNSRTLIDNVTMARAIAQATQQIKPAHLIYLSSDSVYPYQTDPVDEQTPAAPDTLYGVMHRARELILEREAGVPLAILRLTGIYGVGDTHNAYGPNRFMRDALETGAITLFGNGEETRDHLHVDDAAGMILATARHRSTGLLNMNHGHSVSFQELASMIAAKTKASVKMTPRQMPITQRHFDAAARRAAFPEFTPRSLIDGLDGTYQALQNLSLTSHGQRTVKANV